MQGKTLKGALTALVTPMNADGSVDFGALKALVQWQLAEGIHGLVPCGTTGESATMTADERADVIRAVVDEVAGKVPVIAGAGSNSTAVAIEHQKRAADTGADYALVVTPYYNKPSAEGLFRHYEAVSEAADIATILYNVPGRTGCDMKPETVARLAKLERIAGIKEATGDVDRVAQLAAIVPEDFFILSGDDPTACTFAWMGGHGVISVSSNVAPKAMAQMMALAGEGDVPKARALHRQLRPIFDALFWESNPIPVKAALVMQGRIQEHYRLPLCPMDSALRQKLEPLVKALG